MAIARRGIGRGRDVSRLALFEGKQNADVVASAVCRALRVSWEVEVYAIVIGFVGADAPDLNSLNRDCLLLVVVKKQHSPTRYFSGLPV